MRTPEELEVLYAKFDSDVEKRSRFMRVLLALLFTEASKL